ncbi:phosphotransferase [Paenibacillus tarimensis]
MENSCHLDRKDLQDEIAKVFGTGYRVAVITRMYGGAQKVVYKVDCDNGFSCVLYVWDISKNYFQQEVENLDMTERSYGAELFELNNRYLTLQGIRTPALYSLNQEKNVCPFDYALVEYVHGQKAEVYFQADSKIRDELFHQLGDMLSAMHADERQVYGKLDYDGSRTDMCHRMMMENAADWLSYASEHIQSIAANQSKLLDTLYALESKMKPRARYGFIHGELGPDHILVNENLEPYLIDIEGAMFFDIEHEHCFMEIRFGDHYRYLTNDSLDPDRMAFYKLSHHISLTTGGLKLLHRAFPDQKLAHQIYDYNYRSALRFIE